MLATRFNNIPRIGDVKWNAILEANRPELQRFFHNVDYLAVNRYKSRRKAIIALKQVVGYQTRPQTVKDFKDGRFLKADLNLLRAWCLLFDVSLPVMLSVNLEEEDRIKEGLK